MSDAFHSLHGWLTQSPILSVFAVIALGYAIGEVRLPGGFRLGVAGVLFAGLACGALLPSLHLPAEMQAFGLVLFVYCVGLQAAPGFLKSFRRGGLRANLAVLLALLLAFAFAAAALHWSGRAGPLIAGLFCGALTSTPALGAVTDALARAGRSAEEINLAVVGYGVAYPFAIVFVLALVQKLAGSEGSGAPGEKRAPVLTSMAITVDKPAPNGEPWHAAAVAGETGLLLSRYETPDGRIALVDASTRLPPGSTVVGVGTAGQIAAAIFLLGRPSTHSLPAESGGFAMRRYFVSNPDIVGKPLRELQLGRIGAVVTRLRRGDVDMPVSGSTVLQLGDRVRVVSHVEREADVRALFGNSLTSLTETGYFSFALGIVLGLAVGQVPLPLPGLSEPVRLGVAGGPLLVALLLGRLGRTGPFIWLIPAEVNLALRHLGTLLFLASVGVKAGSGLLIHLRGDGWFMIAVALAVVGLAHSALFWWLRRLGQRKVAANLGTASAMQTQPAMLAFAAARADGGPLNAAYAAAYPLAMVLKIILAQLLIAR